MTEKEIGALALCQNQKVAFSNAIGGTEPHWRAQNAEKCTAAIIACTESGYSAAANELQKCGFARVAHCSAVLGRKLRADDINALLTPRALQCLRSGMRESFFDTHSVNDLGCYLSHVFLWTRLARGTLGESLLICEEDVRAPAHENSVAIGAQIDALVGEAGGAKSFDMLWLSAHSTWQHGGREAISEYSDNLVQTRGPLQCTQAYILTRRGARKLLQRAVPIDTVTDAYVWQVARMQPDFLLLRPRSAPLFAHSFANFWTSSIGYSLTVALSIIVPTQHRIAALGVWSATIAALSAALTTLFVNCGA